MKGRSIAIGLAVLLPVAGVAAAVAVEGGDDKPAVLQVLDNGSGGGAETALAPAADSAKRSSLSMMAYVTYEAGPDLPELDGKARAYRVVSDGDPAAIAARVAKAYGVSGIPEERDGAWIVSDGGHEVSVFPAHGMQWTAYSTSPVYAEGKAAETRSSGECTADGVCSSPPVEPDYVEPTRPANLPTKAEAQQIAIDFLEKVGVDTAGAHVQVDDGVTSWSVSVDPVVDGVRTFGLGSYVGVGDKGVIEYANGSLASFEKGDEYDLIGTRAAIDKLNEQSSAYLSGGEDTLEARSDTGTATGAATPDVAPDTPVCDAEPCDNGSANVTDPSCAADACSTPGSPGVAGGGSSGSGGSTVIEPLPAEDLPADGGEPVPPPEPTVITLTDGEVGLLYYPVFDEKGSNGWLVPAYLLTADAEENLGIYTAVAIADEFLAPMEPVPAERNAVDVGTPVDSGPATKTDD